MSRSNPDEEIVNPAVKFFEWDSTNKCFKYYNKAEKKNILQPLPFTFIVLDSLVCIKGFSKKMDSGFYSNEIKNLKKEIITVRGKTGVLSTGLYEKIKKDNDDYQFTQSVYVAYKEGDNLVIGNIGFRGASLGEWFNFKKTAKLMEIAVTVKSTVEDKTGAVVFNKPVFSARTIDEKTNVTAILLDKEVQEYLKKYFKRSHEQIAEGAANEVAATESRSGQPEPSQEQLEAEHLLASQTERTAVPIVAKQSANNEGNDDLPF